MLKQRNPFLILLLFLSLQAGATTVRSQTARFALVIGNNMGSDPDETLQFAETDARRFYRVLRELGGFDKDHTRLLVGADVDQVWQLIYELENQIRKIKERTGKRSIFLFYYSGHADGESLELGQSTLRFKSLLTFLKDSGADVRLAVLDSCRSGELVAIKSGAQQTATHFETNNQLRSKGYAIITSSARNELSQESNEIRGSFFTHYLVSAMRGAADKSKDGQVSLSEAYKYAYEKTALRTSVTLGGGQHPMYEFNLKGRGDLVLTYVNRPTSSFLEVDLPEPGRLVIIDGLGEEMMAELQVNAHRPAGLHIQHGSYRVYLLSNDNAVRMAHAEVKPNTKTVLNSEHFETVAITQSVSKGGLFLKRNRTHHRHWSHTVSLGAQWRRFPLIPAVSSMGMVMTYRAKNRNNWQPFAMVDWSSRADAGISKGYNALGIKAGLGYVLPFSPLNLHIEALSGYDTIWQKSRPQNEANYTAGFNYMGRLGLSRNAGRFVFSLDTGVGGRVFQIQQKGWVHRLDMQFLLGVGYQWEN